MESSRTITWTIMLVLIALAGSKKVVVSYFGEDFLVDSGCRTKDETVLRWHKFCSSLYPNSTLCVTDTFGKNVLTVPKYSNLCDALCHTRIQKKMRICPTEEGEEPRQIFPTGFQVEAGPGESKRVILSYGNSEYLVNTGCPVQNKRVQRYYQLCLTSYQHRTLCRQDRLAGGATITFPEYTDICSAMCHNTLDARQIFCPAKGRIIGPSPV